MFKKLGLRIFFIILSSSLMSSVSLATQTDSIWEHIDASMLERPDANSIQLPSQFQAFRLDKKVLRSMLSEVKRSPKGPHGLELKIPMPDGSFHRFLIEHSLIVEPELLRKYPEVGETYSGQGIDDRSETIRLDFVAGEFHAMILSEKGTIFVDPYSREDSDNYITFFETRQGTGR
ncbi:MAG: hypothetical protein QM785_05930 [Pyrinomonadaceae bacterium]